MWLSDSQTATLSDKFYIVDVLLFLAIVTHQHTLFLVDNMKQGFHWFVVGDAFRVVALHDAS